MKKVLQQTDGTHLKVPKYDELSVKNIYPDAIKDDLIGPYLPNLDQSSNKLPERDYFFAIIGTLKPDYLTKIVTDANKVRFSAND